eukprot:2816598-Alexandrium_andersonii.AAC.1
MLWDQISRQPREFPCPPPRLSRGVVHDPEPSLTARAPFGKPIWRTIRGAVANQSRGSLSLARTGGAPTSRIIWSQG